MRDHTHQHHSWFLTTSQDERTQQQDLECPGCGHTFHTRNVHVRHLRGENEASIDIQLSMAKIEEEILTTTILWYVYFDGM